MGELLQTVKTHRKCILNGKNFLPPSDVKLVSCYFQCAGYFRVFAVINSTHKDA